MKQMLILAACVLAAPWAQADGDKRARVPLLPAYVQECGSCHVAFAPGLLPAASWQRQMNGLDKHYGTDASIDASVARSIAVWLTANAGTANSKRGAEAPPEDRISRAAWFVREHRESSVPFSHPAVKTAANCAACHTRAADGRYREREITLPR